MDGKAWWDTVPRVAKSQTRLSSEHFHIHTLPSLRKIESPHHTNIHRHGCTHTVSFQWLASTQVTCFHVGIE